MKHNISRIEDHPKNAVNTVKTNPYLRQSDTYEGKTGEERNLGIFKDQQQLYKYQ